MRFVSIALATAATACAHANLAASDPPLKTQAQAGAEEQAFRAAVDDCPRPVIPPRSVDIATLRDRIEARHPGRTTYFDGDLLRRAPSQRISMDVKDATVAQVLRMFAEVARTNLVVGDDVGGRVTLKLSNVAWDRALLVLCQTRGLHANWEGTILHVQPLKAHEG